MWLIFLFEKEIFLFCNDIRVKKTIIIGAGVAGMAAAIRLRAKGFDVQVYEANPYPGGKLSEIRLGAYRFDAGPSLFTMPQFLEALFAEAGKDLSDYFAYKRKEVVCAYFFEDGTRFTAFADREEYVKECERKFEVEAGTIRKYLHSAKKKYDLTAGLFLERSLHRWDTYWRRDTLKAVAQLFSLDIFHTMDGVNRSFFKDPRLQQLFNRYATYNGSSPYLTPGIMTMIPHLEQHFGTFIPRGGMVAITQALYTLAEELGVQFHLGKKVDKIWMEKGKAVGIEEGGNRIAADVVLSNMDVVPTYRKLLPDVKAPEKTLSQERSSSALIFYWGVRAEFPELDLHNIFFSKDYKAEFKAIFQENKVSDDPTVYINITSKDEPGDAPQGAENWFVMINVPGNKGQDWDEIIERSRKNILKRISTALGKDVEPLIEVESILDPRTIESKTQSYQGSLYGAASNDAFSSFLRHPNAAASIENLYFCGGSVHPGGGIPLCMMSGKIAAEWIVKDHPLHK
jgi:phytoene desaturase